MTAGNINWFLRAQATAKKKSLALIEVETHTLLKKNTAWTCQIPGNSKKKS